MATKPTAPNIEQLREALMSPVVARYAQQSMEPLGDTGPLRSTPAGQIILELADKVLTFRCPTYGEYQQVTADVEAPAPDPDGVEADAVPVAWWRRAASILANGELPAQTDLPLWLLNPVLVAQAQAVWLQRPTQAPGT